MAGPRDRQRGSGGAAQLHRWIRGTALRESHRDARPVPSGSRAPESAPPAARCRCGPRGPTRAVERAVRDGRHGAARSAAQGGRRRCRPSSRASTRRSPGAGSKVEIRYRTVARRGHGAGGVPGGARASCSVTRCAAARRWWVRTATIWRSRSTASMPEPSARAASSGSLALALRLAEVLPVTEAAGTAPVLLLDDALSELDPTVRGHVLHEIQCARAGVSDDARRACGERRGRCSTSSGGSVTAA